MATFPSALFNNTSAAQVDDLDTVNASDVNTVYDELNAIEVELGTNPSDRAIGWASGTFSTASETFATVGARIQNVETGVAAVTTNHVSKLGGSQILPSTASTIGLQIRAATSQSVNLLEIKDSSNAVTTSVNSAGYIVAIDGGSA